MILALCMLVAKVVLDGLVYMEELQAISSACSNTDTTAIRITNANLEILILLLIVLLLIQHLFLLHQYHLLQVLMNLQINLHQHYPGGEF